MTHYTLLVVYNLFFYIKLLHGSLLFSHCLSSMQHRLFINKNLHKLVWAHMGRDIPSSAINGLYAYTTYTSSMMPHNLCTMTAAT